MTPRFIRRPVHAVGRYLRNLFRAPNGACPVPIWVAAGSVAVTALLVAAGIDAAASGKLQSNDLVALQTDLGLVASDDFSGAAGTLPSARMWNIRTGDGGWGNDEKQTYTDSPDNVSLDGEGNLRIVARQDGDDVTSARIDTLGKLDTSNGLLAVRARMPEGQGIHPAIWMLGSGLEVVGYPESGEIDIYEHVNSVRDNSVGAIGPRTDLSVKVPWKVQRRLPEALAGTPGEYHTYWVYREPGLIQIGLDGTTVMELTPDDIPPRSVWVMDDPFFVVLNVAAGGEWPGPVGDSALPAEMSVDWVRMYG
ncbi:glycoside hydrolase family 16 protein [Gordonia sp. PKS22-38]|uniref:Glycoside hydrolase family 16 protein n=1 Tax=Gordonia prachuapensis TaxID=3115651 RepID=A0ABU7MYJ6_9ACTN|nr:glycoside hydrolase family 16 protein [Gordonia sp. PKS22-38]